MKSALRKSEGPFDENRDDGLSLCDLKPYPGSVEQERPYGNVIGRFLKYFYNRFIRLHGSAEEIAWGSAVGLFVAMTPTMGLQMGMAVAVAAFFKINKVAAAATVWVTNPATAPVIYWVNYQLGAHLLGYPVEAGFFSNPSWETFWNSGKHVFSSLLLGGGIAGVCLGTLGYFVTLNMINTARKKARRLREKRARH
jgi:uncharacterized protein (DUF2062 family)